MSPPIDDRKDETHAQRERRKAAEVEDRQKIVAALDVIAEKCSAPNPGRHTNKSLFDWGMLLGTWALALIALCTLRASDRTAADQIKLTRLIERAWLDVRIEPHGPMVFDAKGGRLDVEYLFFNGGKSLAKKALVIAEIRPISAHFDSAGSGGEFNADYKCARPQKQNDVGMMVLPGVQADGGSFTLYIDRKKIDAMQRPGHIVGLEIIGCVDYRSPVLDDRPHQTSFLYLIEVGQGGIGFYPDVSAGKSYPANTVTLQKFPVHYDAD